MSPITTGTATRSTRVSLFLVPPVPVVVIVSRYSGNRSCYLPRSGKKDGVIEGVGQYRDRGVCQRKGAGRIRETAGATNDFKSPGTVGFPSLEIDTIVSFHETDLQ